MQVRRLLERRDTTLQRFHEDGPGFAVPIVVNSVRVLADVNPNQYVSAFVIDPQSDTAQLYVFKALPGETLNTQTLSENLKLQLSPTDQYRDGAWVPFSLVASVFNYDESSRTLTLEP